MFEMDAQISDPVLRDYDLLRDDSGLIDLSQTSLLVMTGEDRKGWLQGQATADLRKLDPGASAVFCLTAITGCLVSVCEAWALPDRLFITLPRITLDNVLKRVEQFVIMEDVAVENALDAYCLLSIQGPTATAKLSEFLALPSLDAGECKLEGATVYAMRSNRTGLGGWDLCIARDESRAIKRITGAFASIGPDAYEIARLEAGIPKFGVDMGEKTLPPELGRAFEDRHVSYSKGCYMGQEVLMRLHSRGHTNRTWVGLLSENALEPGSPVSHLSRQDAGIVTSAAFSPDFGYIGAAMLRNEAAFERELVQVSVGGRSVPAEVRHMPLLR